MCICILYKTRFINREKREMIRSKVILDRVEAGDGTRKRSTNSGVSRIKKGSESPK